MATIGAPSQTSGLTSTSIAYSIIITLYTSFVLSFSVFSGIIVAHLLSAFVAFSSPLLLSLAFMASSLLYGLSIL